jgi:hypothetical protein
MSIPLHGSRRVEVGLADLQVHDVAALGLERAGRRQHLEGRLGPEAGHAAGEVRAGHAAEHRGAHGARSTPLDLGGATPTIPA